MAGDLLSFSVFSKKFCSIYTEIIVSLFHDWKIYKDGAKRSSLAPIVKGYEGLCMVLNSSPDKDKIFIDKKFEEKKKKKGNADSENE